jgi:SAM-dependent methyltransferase
MIRFRRSRIKLKILISQLSGEPREIVLRHRFNLCAEAWAGNLETAHERIAQKAFQRMNLSPGDRILEVGCGDGWASRIMADAASEVVGVDISSEMIRYAQQRSASGNVRFICSPAERIPYADNYFTKALSIEAFYYFHDQEQVLRELLRVIVPGGQLFLAFCLYKDYAEGLAVADEVSVPVQIRSAAEYIRMLQRTGWAEVQDDEFVMKGEPGRRKPEAHARTLFLGARKPDSRSGSVPQA